ncbi:MAG TPA: ATP-binding protein, partial [Bacilli bacterium]
ILDVPDEKVKNYLTLKLLLQPIVENAFLHGIETMNRKGLIKVRAFEDQEKLIFEVTDNGRGISENALKELENKLFFNRGETEQKLGIGLKNVHERIQLYFGDSYGLKISSHENEGTLVSITIPLIMENKNKETT